MATRLHRYAPGPPPQHTVNPVAVRVVGERGITTQRRGVIWDAVLADGR